MQVEVTARSVGEGTVGGGVGGRLLAKHARSSSAKAGSEAGEFRGRDGGKGGGRVRNRRTAAFHDDGGSPPPSPHPRNPVKANVALPCLPQRSSPDLSHITPAYLK